VPESCENKDAGIIYITNYKKGWTLNLSQPAYLPRSLPTDED